ncbi:MAG: hypothetical protein IJT89_10560 [Bacteroidaceae bacterium]|nr:hypothetical protein [Bacteroidaceae bacterium]
MLKYFFICRGIKYWVTFLNGVVGREHSHEQAENSAKIFNQLKSILVGIGGLTLFPGIQLLEEAQRGLDNAINHGEMDRMAAIRSNKRTL